VGFAGAVIVPVGVGPSGDGGDDLVVAVGAPVDVHAASPPPPSVPPPAYAPVVV
jgi:hypothetical protein